MTKYDYLLIYQRTPEKFKHGIRRFYYAQFVTDEVKAFILNTIPKKLIINSIDPHFNDISDGNWDTLVSFLPSTISDKLQEHGDWLSTPTGVCILKEAAQQIRQRP